MNYQKLLDSFNGTLKEEYKKDSDLLRYCLEQYMGNYALQFDSEALTEDLVNEFGDTCVNMLLADSVIVQFVFQKNKDWRGNPFLFQYVLRQGNMELASMFDSKLFTEDVVESHLEELVNYYQDGKYFPFYLCENKSLFQYYVNQGNFSRILDFDSRMLTPDFIKEHLEQIATELSGRSVFPYEVQYNQDLLHYFLEHHQLSCALQYIDTLLTKEDYETYKEEFLNVFTDEFPNQIVRYRSPDFFHFCLQNGVISYALAAHRMLWTDQLLDRYQDVIIDYIQNHLEGEIPGQLSDNSHFFEICLARGNYSLAMSFDSSLFSSEVVSKYATELLSAFQKYEKVPYNLRDNEVIFQMLLKNDAIDRTLDMSSSFFTAEILSQYKEQYVQAFLNYSILPIGLSKNHDVYQFLIENGLYHAAFECSSSFLTQEVIEQYGPAILEYMGKSVYIPPHLANSEILLKYCLQQNRFDIVIKFSSSLFNRTLLNEYGGKFLHAIRELGDVPYSLGRNQVFIDYCVQNDAWDVVLMLPERIFTPEFCNRYGNSIVDQIRNSGIFPDDLSTCESLLKFCLERQCFDFIDKFAPEMFTSTLIEQYKDVILKMIHDKSDIIPQPLTTSLVLFNCYLEQGRVDMLMQFSLPKEFYEKKEEVAKILPLLNISYSELIDKLNYLEKNNDEIYSYIKLGMLGHKMDGIDKRHIERLSMYGDIQNTIMSLEEDDIPIFSRILDILDNEQYDLTAVVYQTLHNLHTYKFLMKGVPVDSLSEDQLKNFIYILLRTDNMYDIHSMQDLTKDAFESKQDQYFKKVEELIQTNQIDLESLKQAFFEKKFGLSMKMAAFMDERYCHDMEGLKNSEIDPEIVQILSFIHQVYHAESLEQLSCYFNTPKQMRADFHSTIFLESFIRKEYASKFQKSLYQVKEEHRIDENHPLKQDGEIYHAITNTTYQGKNPKVYLVDGDFNMQIHALGAYSYYEVPNNFQEDWERPKISNHGICTSYIGNNQIATARIKHPVYGFASYEESALLCAGNYDLVSRNVTQKYASSVAIPYRFFPPREMINHTRHNHNEMVLERRSNRKGTSFKRKPDYVVYFVDDVHNVKNFSDDCAIWKETVQASIDQDIPIVIVDRLMYAKKEQRKAIEVGRKFFETKDCHALEELFLIWMNNSVGCRKFELQEKAQYHDYFTIDALAQIYKRVLYVLKDEQLVSSKKIEIIDTLKNILTKESALDQDHVLSPLNIEESLPYLEELKQSLLEKDMAIESETGKQI